MSYKSVLSNGSFASVSAVKLALKTMLILLLVTMYNYIFAEGRVYCQDSNASPWSTHGYSCPVNCNNVIHAVERLKLLDVDSILENDTSENKTASRTNRTETDTKTNNLYIICERILKNKMAYNDVATRLGQFNTSSCGLFLKKIKAVRVERGRRCSRRAGRNYEGEFVSYFTDILNKHVHGKYKFTEDLTSMILGRLLGDNVNLRHGVVDVHKLLQYLKRALLRRRARAHPATITLKSRHCLTIHTPGCYCLHGYVESSGQCVKPADCFPDNVRLEYLPRVIIL